MAKKKERIAGIDIGTTKICTAIGQSEHGRLRLLGAGTAPSKGLRKGIVVNLSETIQSIKTSLELAEEQSQTVVESACVSVGGAYIRGLNSRGETQVRGRNGEIGGDDVERAVSMARDLEIPENYEVIHVLTQTYCLDGQEGIVDPVGMFGRHLAVKLHLVVNASAIVQNIVNAVNKANVVVEGVVMQQLASAESILSEDEKELGTFVVDIGGGTTDVAVYSQGSVWHSEVLPMGGNLITKDLAIGLKAPIQEAEQIKKMAGSVFPESVPVEEMVEISEVGTRRRRTVARRQVSEIVRARCDEVLDAVHQIARKVGLNRDLITGVVLTGGGSLLDGLTDRAEQIFQMPVRLGYPINVVDRDSEICHPAYSTALGLLKYSSQIRDPDGLGPVRGFFAPRGGWARTERMKNWLLEKIS